MDTDAMIEAFGRLPTTDARLRAIEALMQTLSPHEWRAVHSIAAARAFQFDIIGRLPVELVAQIFSYLDTSTPYRLQPVSRQWCHILRSSAVLRNSLLSWFRTLDQDVADYRLLELKAKAIQAYRHGKPKHCFKVVTPVSKHVILMADTLIWSPPPSIGSESRIVNLFNITTWEMHTLNGNAREHIHHLFASNQIVGFTTRSNICYVSDLRGRGKRKFKVPNAALFQSLACRDRTVACAGILEDHVLVYIWNYDSQQGRSFTIASDCFPIEFRRPLFTHRQGLALLLQPENARITVFVDGRCTMRRAQECCASENVNHQCTIWYGQFDYTGDIKWDAEHFLDYTNWKDHAFLYVNNPFAPVDDSGKFRICVGDVLIPDYGRDEHKSRWFQYDERLKEFTEPNRDAETSLSRGDTNLFWWKDTFYSSLGTPDHHPDHPPEMNRSILAYLGTSEIGKYEPLIFEEEDPTSRREPLHSRDAIVLNDKYVIRACKDYFHMLCFDDNPNYPTADVDFFDMGSVVLTETQSQVLLRQNTEEMQVDL